MHANDYAEQPAKPSIIVCLVTVTVAVCGSSAGDGTPRKPQDNMIDIIRPLGWTAVNSWDRYCSQRSSKMLLWALRNGDGQNGLTSHIFMGGLPKLSTGRQWSLLSSTELEEFCQACKVWRWFASVCWPLEGGWSSKHFSHVSRMYFGGGTATIEYPGVYCSFRHSITKLHTIALTQSVASSTF